MSHIHLCRFLICLFGFALVTVSSSAQSPRLKTIALAGQPAPDGLGNFELFNDSVLGESGGIVFWANTQLGGNGIFFGDGESVQKIVTAGDATPNGNGQFSWFFQQDPGFAINAANQVVFRAFLENTTGGSADNEGIFLWEDGIIRTIARKGMTSPDGDGIFNGFRNHEIALNDNGMISFFASLTDTNSTEGLFRGTVDQLETVIRLNDLSPDGNGLVGQINAPAINNKGEVACLLYLYQPQAELLIRYDGTVEPVARNGDLAIGAQFSIMGINIEPSISESGIVYFQTGAGIYASNGISAVKIIEIEQAAPNGGVFNAFGQVVVNSVGTLAFNATTFNNPGVEGGIYRIIDGNLSQIYSSGQAVNEQPVTYNIPGVNYLNDRNEVAFAGNFQTSNANPVFIYLIDESGQYEEIVEAGIDLEDSTIAFPLFFDGLQFTESTGFNSRSQFAFTFGLGDGRAGVALWTPFVLGDLNCDGVVDLLDVSSFVDAVLNGQLEESADINGDGEVNLLDVEPFVDLLTQ